MQERPTRDQFAGCLLASRWATPLGAFEGLNADNIYWGYGTGHALLELPAGESLCYTDDTEMMVGVAQTLVDHGHIAEEPLCQAFADNYHPERGYGQGARLVIEAIAEGGDWLGRCEPLPRGSLGNARRCGLPPSGCCSITTLTDSWTRPSFPPCRRISTHSESRGHNSWRSRLHSRYAQARWTGGRSTVNCYAALPVRSTAGLYRLPPG